MKKIYFIFSIFVIGIILLIYPNVSNASTLNVSIDSISTSGAIISVSSDTEIYSLSILRETSNGEWVRFYKSKEGGYTSKQFFISKYRLSSESLTNIKVIAYDKDGNIISSEASSVEKVPTEEPDESGMIADGAYIISPSAKTDMALDSETDLLLSYKDSRTSQRFYFEYLGKGYYKITSINSALPLSVENSSTQNGAKVILATGSNSSAQRWKLVRNDDNTYSFISECSGKALNISTRTLDNKSPINQYDMSYSSSQKFKLESVELISPGIVKINPKTDTNKCLDIDSCSSDNNVQLQIYDANDTLAQRFEIERIDKDKVRIRTAASGGYLTEDSSSSGAKVVQRGSSSTEVNSSNTWLVEWHNGIAFKNQESGLMLDVVGGGTGNYTKLQVYPSNDTVSQKFVVNYATLVNTGKYELTTPFGTTLDVYGAGTASGTNVQVYTINDTIAQIFYVEDEGSSYKISNIASNLPLDVENGTAVNGTNVRIWDNNNSNAQRFSAEIADGGYISFKNVGTGLYLDSGSGQSGANVSVWSKNNEASQRWKLVEKNITVGWQYINGAWHYYDSTGQDVWTGDHAKYVRDVTIKITSKTDWYIVLDSDNSTTTVFQRDGNDWKPVKEFFGRFGGGKYAGGGATYQGLSEITRKFYHATDGGDYYWLSEYHRGQGQEENGQCIHGVPGVGPTSEAEPGTGWGTDGCNRLKNSEAKWVYDNVPIGSAVYSIPGDNTYDYGEPLL